MSDEARAVEAPENPFEAPARGLSEFFIRAVILPVTLLFTKPSAIVRAAETGAYRPLPSPFLLALITGVVVSGVTSNLDALNNALSSENNSGISRDEARKKNSSKSLLTFIPGRRVWQRCSTPFRTWRSYGFQQR